MVVRIIHRSAARWRGLELVFGYLPRVPLRSTLGYTLAPASRADGQVVFEFFKCALRSRLRVEDFAHNSSAVKVTVEVIDK